MIEKAKINLTSMEFTDVKANLKAFLKNQNEFIDYNFEGSGLSVILDLLAYNSQHTAYLANMLANEAEIDSATLRSNVISRAKLLGYTPKSTTASRAIISISVDDTPNPTTSSLLLPRGTRFVVKSQSQQFIFVTLEDFNLYLDDFGVFRNNEVEVFEGSIKAYSFDVSSAERRYIIPSKKIDINTLKVGVYDNPNSNEYTVFEKASGINKIGSNTNAFWGYETDNGFHELKFGDGVFGKQPILNGIVYCEYLECNGSTANDLSAFSLVRPFDGYQTAVIGVETINPSAGGSEPEATSSVKINAPRFYQSQNRAITKEDFKAITNDIYPYAKSVSVWGGEETTPPQYGKVFISIIPKSLTRLTTSNKRDIEKKIKLRTVAGISPVIIDPKYVNLNITLFATVRKNATNGLGDFSNQIRNLTKTYFDTTFGIFDTNFYYSNLLAEIKNSSRAIAGVRAEYTLSLVNSLEQSNFAFENPIIPGSVRTNKIRLIGTTEFYAIEDTNMDGTLYAGAVSVGTVDYESGKVVINVLKIQETSNGILEVFVNPLNDDIVSGVANAIVLNVERLSVELRSV